MFGEDLKKALEDTLEGPLPDFAAEENPKARKCVLGDVPAPTGRLRSERGPLGRSRVEDQDANP